MCHMSIVMFAARNLTQEDVRGKSVIEVGSMDINGSIRPIIELLYPSEFVGVDITMGRGVDKICAGEDLVKEFGAERFDLVISTELLEHVHDWQKVISNMKGVCKSGGVVLISTRSYGYPYHSHPYDYWRYEVEDIKNIFSDCKIEHLETDRELPGVFLKSRKPDRFVENDLTDYELYSMVIGRKVASVSSSDFRSLHFKGLMLKVRMRNLAGQVKQIAANIVPIPR